MEQVLLKKQEDKKWPTSGGIEHGQHKAIILSMVSIRQLY